MEAGAANTDGLSARQKAQYLAEYFGFRLLVGLFRLMPLDTSAAVSAFLWRTVAPRTFRHKRALDNIARAFPEKTPAEREQIAHGMWDNLGRVFAEGMQLDRLLREPDRLEIAGQDHLFRYARRHGPSVGVTLHYGNWELSSYPQTAYGMDPAAVYRLVKNPYVDQFIRQQRAPLYPGGLFAKGRAHGSNAEGQKTARRITDFVRAGGRLGIVSDLYDKAGIEVPFFGHPARSTPMPAMIARRVGARFWAARTVRKGKSSRFRIEVIELPVHRTANMGEDVRTMTADVHALFEGWVREHPEQWMWINRRWG
ncbi:MAG: lipid A biosynthesis acyltransferase [Pseudomonadota bacterium]